MGDTPAPATWRKSSRSVQGNCVEVAATNLAVLVRDSKDPDGPRLRVSEMGWRAFLDNLR